MRDKLDATNDVFATDKPGDLHVAVGEHIHFDALSDRRQGHQDRVRSVPTDGEMDSSRFKLVQQVIEGMTHGNSLGLSGHAANERGLARAG